MGTYEKVVGLLCEQLGTNAENVTPESDIIKDLGADSLDVVQMLMSLEDEFGITVSEESAAELKTVADIVAMIDGNK